MADEENEVENPEEQVNEGEEGEEEKKEEPLLDSEGNPINPDEGPKEPQNPLKIDMLRKSVKNLQLTYSGLSYAYTELDLKEKELDDIGTDLNNFTQIRDFNASTNKLPHINPIGNMPFLVRVDASVNEINDIQVLNNPDRFQFLQILNLKQNKIKVLPEMQAKNLFFMDLSENKIKDCSAFKGLPKLKKLNLNQNRLSDCTGMAHCPELEVLYLNNNRITSLKGMSDLPALRKLRLRTNQIEKFDYIPDLPNLQKLAISENAIKDNTQFSLLKYPTLKRINIDGNPYFEESGVSGKLEILIQLEGFDNIKFVNKEEITPEDKEEVPRVKEERRQKAEEERLQREEEERQRKEEEEKLRLEREEEERQKREEEEKERQAAGEGEEGGEKKEEGEEGGEGGEEGGEGNEGEGEGGEEGE